MQTVLLSARFQNYIFCDLSCFPGRQDIFSGQYYPLPHKMYTPDHLFLLLLKFLLVILIETWYNLLVVYFDFCNSIIPQKRLLSYPFRISLQSFLLSLFFYSHSTFLEIKMKILNLLNRKFFI